MVDALVALYAANFCQSTTFKTVGFWQFQDDFAPKQADFEQKMTRFLHSFSNRINHLCAKKGEEIVNRTPGGEGVGGVEARE